MYTQNVLFVRLSFDVSYFDTLASKSIYLGGNIVLEVTLVSILLQRDNYHDLLPIPS